MTVSGSGTEADTGHDFAFPPAFHFACRTEPYVWYGAWMQYVAVIYGCDVNHPCFALCQNSESPIPVPFLSRSFVDSTQDHPDFYEFSPQELLSLRIQPRLIPPFLVHVQAAIM